ncbi:MAG: hypothetical protein ACYC9K_00940 [Sulfuricaulis sp.]
MAKAGTIGFPKTEEDYQAEQDLHHLTKAHQIKSNPKRHKKALNLAKQRMQEMQAVATPQPPLPGTAGESDGGGTQT